MDLRIRELNGQFVVQSKRFLKWTPLPDIKHFCAYYHIRWHKEYVVIYRDLKKAQEQKDLYDLAFN